MLRPYLCVCARPCSCEAVSLLLFRSCVSYFSRYFRAHPHDVARPRVVEKQRCFTSSSFVIINDVKRKKERMIPFCKSFISIAHSSETKNEIERLEFEPVVLKRSAF